MRLETPEQFERLLSEPGMTFGYTPYFVWNGSAYCEDCTKDEADEVKRLICEGRDVNAALTDTDSHIHGVACDKCSVWIAEPDFLEGDE